ncbi:hypothetical protein LEN26_008309 [Aphanomyces euteiches]|nr:hypothetical protein AeMF1_011001 [Aphanomyces euteiches]KAH9130669.1 hypothetical protein LEN26_008309 [Aphanomyces euteiches]
MIVAAQMRPMFWSSSRTGDEAHNAENMSKMLIQVIHEIEESCGEGSVCGVVIDNASVMKKACQALQAAKKSILYNGCAGNATNLIIGKLFDSSFPFPIFKDVLDKAKKVAKFVRIRTALLARFRWHQDNMFTSGHAKRALSLPVATRWYSSERCIQSVVDNHDVLVMTFRDSEFIKRFEVPASEKKVWEVQEIIENPVFWSQAIHVLRLTEPISKSLAILEQDDCSASLVYETFMGMMNHHAYSSGGDLELAVLDTINRRWRDFHSRNMLAAYLLDPTKSLTNFMVGDKL